DFYPALLDVPALKALKEGAGQYELDAPGEHELAEIVRLPAEIAGLPYEEDEKRSLAELLITDARTGRDALPLLQYTLTLLEERKSTGRMPLEAYDALGGLEGAIGQQAETAWGNLSQEA